MISDVSVAMIDVSAEGPMYRSRGISFTFGGAPTTAATTMTRQQDQRARPWKGRRNVDAACRRWSGNDGGGEIAETGTMFGGGWGWLAARGVGSRGGDGGVALGLSPFFYP